MLVRELSRSVIASPYLRNVSRYVCVHFMQFIHGHTYFSTQNNARNKIAEITNSLLGHF